MLCRPLAMASLVRSSLIISHTPRSGCNNNQTGAWTAGSCSVHQKPSLVKFRVVSSLSHSNGPYLIATMQLASATTTPTTAEIVYQDRESSSVDNTQETATLLSESDAPRLPSLPKWHAHVSELFSQLCSGVDVPSAMDPWLQELSIFDWNQLLVECATIDWKISVKIMDFFREKEALLDQAVLFPPKRTETVSDSRGKSSHDLLTDCNGGVCEEAVLGTQQEETLHRYDETMDSLTEGRTSEGDEEKTTSSTLKCPPSLDLPGKNDQEEEREMITPALKLYTTLINLLSRRKMFEEVDRVHLYVKEAGLEPNGHYFNVLLESYIERRSFTNAFEVMHTMKSAGFEPHHYIHDKLAYIYMNQENPDTDTLKDLAEDFKERSPSVFVAIYRKLLKTLWEARDLAGAEEAFEVLLAVGCTPELKDFLKVMQLNGRRGNHTRVVKLMKHMVKLGMRPVVSVYDYLMHAYCKAGLLEKAEETLLKYEMVLNTKPSPLALNMLVDGYGKQGLYEEAQRSFEQIKSFGYRPTEVSYSCVISAMAQAGKVNSAVQYYEGMLREGRQPNAHTYLTLIRSYTKANRTREGHKMYKTMRTASIEMTEVGYSTVLVLYVEGNWYQYAAALLREAEEKEKALDAAAHSALIRSFSLVETMPTPLVKAVQESKYPVCKVLTDLFRTISNRQAMEQKLIDAVFDVLEEWREVACVEDRGLVYNAFLDYFWRKGYRGMARRILDEGREVYAGYSRSRVNEREWLVNVSGLGIGGAKAALTDHLIRAEEELKERTEDDDDDDDWKVVVKTGDGFSLNLPQDNSVVKQMVESMLTELGSPFIGLNQCGGMMEASLADVLTWLSRDEVKTVLSFTDTFSSV